MPARLKVFAARLGFFDTVVAAPSQKAALAAWGVHQDLFKDGSAAPTDDPAAQAALNKPGVVLRRMAGSSGSYEETPAISGEGLIPAAPKPSGKRSPPAKPKPPPDRSTLTAAEKALAAAEDELHAALETLADRRRALDAEEATLQRDGERRRRALAAELERARSAYRRAGGEA